MDKDLIGTINNGVSNLMNNMFGGKTTTPPVQGPSPMQGPIPMSTPTPAGASSKPGLPTVNGVTGPWAPPVSTTTLSNSNKIDTVNANNQKLQDLSNKGNTTDANGNVKTSNGEIVTPPTTQVDTTTTKTNAAATPPPPPPTYTDAQGVQRNSDGSPAVIPAGSTYNGQGNYTGPDGKLYAPPATDTSYADSQTIGLLDTMKATTDSVTAQNIAAIQAAFAVRKQQQTQTNTAAEGRVNNALLMGGVTGQGSSAQFAPVSSSGIIQAQETYGIQQLANLDAMENSAIAAAQAAGNSQNFKIMEDKLNVLSTIRQTKIDAAVKLQDLINTNNQKILEQNRQSAIDNSIAGAFSSGVTNPADIITSLAKKGVNVTAEQVTKTLQSISGNYGGVDISKLSADTQEFFRMKQMPGGLPVSILALPDTASQLSAYLQMKNLAITGGKNLIPGAAGSAGYGTSATSGAGSGAINVATYAGIGDTTAPLSQVVQQVGMDKIVSGIIKNEGGSPQGVVNNPGNIKFVGLPGQIDSGVKATDGGTFASYATPQAGRDAIAALVQKAADKGLTFEAALNAYTGTKPAPGSGATQTDFAKTGDAPTKDNEQKNYVNYQGIDTGLTNGAIYQDALQFMSDGKIPSVGIGSTPKPAAIRAAIQNKAAAVLSAYGATLPQYQALFKADQQTVSTQIQRVGKVDTISASLSAQFPRLATLADKVGKIGIQESDITAGKAAAQSKFGSVDAANYVELVQTVRADYAALQAAIAGGRGGQGFYDAATKAIPIGLTSQQYIGIMQTIVQSAANVKSASNDSISAMFGNVPALTPGGTGSIGSSAGGSNASDFLNTPVPGANGSAVDWSKAPQ